MKTSMGKPCVVWFTGLSGAGKSTIAEILHRRLTAAGCHAYVLDGDDVRRGLNRDLGYTARDRAENIRRIAEVARLMADARLVVLVAAISPFRADRRAARALMPAGTFIEVFVDTPLAVAETRDPKGLYRKARRGELPDFTGIDSPYELPESPELRVDTVALTAEQAADAVFQRLQAAGIIAQLNTAGTR
jgi:bifunctional enzyme CysN/CysC